MKYLLILSLLFVGCTKQSDPINFETLHALSLESCKYGYIRGAIDFRDGGIILPNVNLAAYANLETAEKACKDMVDEAVKRK